MLAIDGLAADRLPTALHLRREPTPIRVGCELSRGVDAIQALTSASTLPLVSLVVRTVNRPHYLRECLNSIIAQDYPNIEIVLVNDGGPSVAKLVQELDVPGMHSIFELDNNIGRSASGNFGLERCSGAYVGFIDDDDIFYPFHVSTLLQRILETGARVVYSDALEARQIRCPFDERIYMTTEHRLMYSRDFDRRELFTTNFIPILCPLFSADLIQKGVRFDTMLDVLEDWDLWLQLSEHEQFVHVREVTAEYRFRVDGSNTVGQLQHRWRWSHDYIKEKYRAAAR